jgi:hypothetical protein
MFIPLVIIHPEERTNSSPETSVYYQEWRWVTTQKTLYIITTTAKVFKHTTFRFHKMQGSSWLTEELLASQEGPCSMKLINFDWYHLYSSHSFAGLLCWSRDNERESLGITKWSSDSLKMLYSVYFVLFHVWQVLKFPAFSLIHWTL